MLKQIYSYCFNRLDSKQSINVLASDRLYHYIGMCYVCCLLMINHNVIINFQFTSSSSFFVRTRKWTRVISHILVKHQIIVKVSKVHIKWRHHVCHFRMSFMIDLLIDCWLLNVLCASVKVYDHLVWC
jgi:hypothetical protein